MKRVKSIISVMVVFIFVFIVASAIVSDASRYVVRQLPKASDGSDMIEFESGVVRNSKPMNIRNSANVNWGMMAYNLEATTDVDINWEVSIGDGNTWVIPQDKDGNPIDNIIQTGITDARYVIFQGITPANDIRFVIDPDADGCGCFELIYQVAD